MEEKEVTTTTQPKAMVPFVQGKGLVPDSFEGMYRMAQVMSASGLMPKGLDRPESCFVALQFGYELGLTPMQAVQNIAVVNGRPTIWGDAMLALVRQSGLMVSFEERQEGEGDSLRHTCIVRRRGDEKPVARSFSIRQAKAAGLMSKDTWQKYGGRMCQMRARSWALRDAFPDVLKGIRSPADVDDGELVDVTPTTTKAQPAKPVEETTKQAAPDYGSEPTQAAGMTPITDEDIKQLQDDFEGSADASAGDAGIPRPDEEAPTDEELIEDDEPDLPPVQAPGPDSGGNGLDESHPLHPTRWINQRSGNIKAGTGLASYLYKHRDLFPTIPQQVKTALQIKWAKLYKQPFPLDPRPPEPKPEPELPKQTVVNGGAKPSNGDSIDTQARLGLIKLKKDLEGRGKAQIWSWAVDNMRRQGKLTTTDVGNMIANDCRVLGNEIDQLLQLDGEKF